MTDIAIFNLYSGFRPTKTLLIENVNVDLENWLIVSGMKTEAGTDRTVHRADPQKSPAYCQKHHDADRRYLFRNERNEFMTYDQSRRCFKRVRSQLRIEHTPPCRLLITTHLKNV